MRLSPRRKGYTLLEVTLVMTIIVILMAVSMPTIDAVYGDTRVRGAADEVRGAWAEARSRAIETGNPFRFGVMRDTERYRIAPDGPEFWDGSKGSTGQNFDDGTDRTGSLPSGIKFSPPAEAQDEGGWVNVATFLPDGTCKDDARVEIREGRDALSIILSVRGLTGVVTVKTRKEEEEQ